MFQEEQFNFGPSGEGFELPGVLDEGGNFLRAVFGPLTLTRWNAAFQPTGQRWYNYHIRVGQSAAVGTGANVNAESPYLLLDFDRGARPAPQNAAAPDIGADEVPPQSSPTRVLP